MKKVEGIMRIEKDMMKYGGWRVGSSRCCKDVSARYKRV